MDRLPSYISGDCCPDCDCQMGSESQPCWGECRVVAEEYTEDDHWWIHACEGHEDCWDGGDYKFSIYPEDQ